jgi:hypothetical protein
MADGFPSEKLEMSPDAFLFVHRPKADGTIVSFCRKCFQTVASSQWEADLERGEKNHKCDPAQLEHLAVILNRISKSDRQKSR